MALHLRTVEPRQGLAWLKAAFRTFFRRPLAFTLLFVVFLLGALVAMALPYLGGIVVMMALPLLSLGYMVATRSALAGGPVHPGQLFEPLRGDDRRRRALLQLCAYYALATLLVMVVSDALDGGRFERVQVLLATPDRSGTETAELDALFDDDRLLWGVVARFGLTALLAIPFWHAPPLVLWGGQGALQALFSSTLAVWRTRAAMLLYVGGWLAMIALVSVAFGLLFGLLGVRQLAGLVAMPAALVFTCVFYVSLYFTFTDTFGDSPAPQGDDAMAAA
ncbi:MAG: BPSS1780 family membrane protein [Gammaproteobacteria bacterium]|uniref:BPSS1780 family membrane protein n=1 Tax=Azohydromonas sp. TaxID=1872666 RepID=UPI002B7E330D|nr:BPSS1780 family membrane protein [Azohydromonas sp.]HMM85263.1 BPSS1780 family membrane protein [Azohydromonas sp.]